MIGIQQWLIIAALILIVFFASPSVLARFRKTSVNVVKEASAFKKDIGKLAQDTEEVKIDFKKVMNEDAKPQDYKTTY